MKRRVRVVVSAGLAVLLAGVFAPAAWAAEGLLPEDEHTAKASEATPGWQSIGSCEWRVDGDRIVLRPAGNADEGSLPSEAELGWPTWPWNDNDEVSRFVIEGRVVCGDTASSLFCEMSNVEAIEGLDRLDTSKATNMAQMFSGCSALASLDLSAFDTSNVTNMVGMFFGCSSLTSLDFSHFDTARVTDMNSLFLECSSLTSLDLTSFDTSRVTDMGAFFENCSSLFFVDLSSFDTSHVGKMDMFGGCSSLGVVELGANCTMQRELPDKTWYTATGEAFTPSTMPMGAAVSYATAPDLLEPLRVQLSETALTVRADAAPFALEATVLPAWRAGKVTWSTSDPAVATVDSAGMVTVHGAGRATISAEAKGVAATCELTVLSAEPDAPGDSGPGNSGSGDSDSGDAGVKDPGGNSSAGGGSDESSGTGSDGGSASGDAGGEGEGGEGQGEAGRGRDETRPSGVDGARTDIRMNLAQTGDGMAPGTVPLLLCDSLALLVLLSVLLAFRRCKELTR